ncbi:HRD1B ligase, partial [Dasyornis broadbenti]|nr:HRD1B ligase [Dasyornis broadbenti]
ESQRKLRHIRNRYIRFPNQSILLWLYDCWFFDAHVDVFLDSNEARQLGPLSWDSAIDWGIGRSTGTLSLWTRLVSSVRAAYTADELIVYRNRWNDKAEGLEYLTELVMADILYWNTRNSEYLDNPDGAYCTWHVWEKFKKSAPPYYAKALSSVMWHKDLKVLKLQDYVWEYGEKPLSLLQDSFYHVERGPKEYAASSDDLCTICHEELSRNQYELACGHEFHRKCIRTWLQKHSNTCPICRVCAVLPKDGPERPAGNNSKCYKAKTWKRSVL